MNRIFFILILSFTSLSGLIGQSTCRHVTKDFSKPVLMHYMPWFDTPEFQGRWGWHWRMNTQDPDSIDASSGQRQIASHFYPLIGPYASIDPDVIEYHLLLMKYSGVDAVIIDWYGVEGSNGDIQSLLSNSNALIEKTGDYGMQFCIMLEDRFTQTVDNAKANLSYCKDEYFQRDEYLRLEDSGAPFMGIFGPITFETEEAWDSIMPAAGEDIDFLTLWYQRNDAGRHADGEYIWIYEDDTKNDFRERIERFYTNRVPNLDLSMGIAYPGFVDFYEEGGAGNRFFVIEHGNGEILDTTLGLALDNEEEIDALQLATWNDFGEGTMFEPTVEYGFDFLVQLQRALGVEMTAEDLGEIHRLYLLRKKFSDDPLRQGKLDQAARYFCSLEVDSAILIMNEVDGILDIGQSSDVEIRVWPNPAQNEIQIQGDYQEYILFNYSGKVIRYGKAKSVLDLSALPHGTYNLMIKGSSDYQLHQIIVK